MKCINCGHDNQENSKFCEECGSVLLSVEPKNVDSVSKDIEEGITVSAKDLQEKRDDIIEEVKEETRQESKEFSDLEETVITNPVNPYEDEEPKKKSKVPFIIIAVVALIALIGAGITFGQEFLKTDEERLIEALTNTQHAGQEIVTGEIGFDDFKIEGVGVMEAAMAENIIKGLKLEYQVMSDMDNYESAGHLSFKMSGSEIIKVKYFINKEYIALGIPALYDEIVFVKWEDIDDIMIKYDLVTEEELQGFEIDPDRVIELVNAYIEALKVTEYESAKDIDFIRYTDLLYSSYTNSILEVAKEPYEMDVAGETKNYDGRVFYLDFDYASLYEDNMDLYKEILEDEALLPIIQEAMDRIFAAMIEHEDELMYNLIMSSEGNEPKWGWEKSNEEDLLSIKEEAKEALVEEYDEAIGEVLEMYEDEEYEDMQRFMTEIYSEIDMNYQLIVEDDYLVGQEMKFVVDDSIIDAIKDSELMQEQAGYELQTLEELDILFELAMYSKVDFSNLNEPIAFEELPSSSVDFAKVTDEELMMMYQEIMMNAQELSAAFGQGF